MAFVSDEMIHKSFPKEKKSIILSLKWRMSYIISLQPPPHHLASDSLGFSSLCQLIQIRSVRSFFIRFLPFSFITQKIERRNTRTERLTCVYSPTAGRPAGVVAGQVPSSVWRIPNRRTNTKCQRIRIKNSCLQAAVYGRNRRVINVGATKIDWNIKRK
jgi:hypothetical protein